MNIRNVHLDIGGYTIGIAVPTCNEQDGRADGEDNRLEGVREDDGGQASCRTQDIGSHIGL